MPTNLAIYGHVDAELKGTVCALQKQNVGIVIREESEIIRIAKENNKRKLPADYEGKGKGKENKSRSVLTPPPMEWDDVAAEWKRINNTDRRGWGIHNRIFIRVGAQWPGYVDIETSTFCRLMLRMLKEKGISR
ncbi:hypothetical protein LguiB_015166 [Lonicera macranthoides]